MRRWQGNRGLIPRPRDHDLSHRQILNQLSHPGTPIMTFNDLIFLRFYLFIHERHRERVGDGVGRDTGRGRSRVHAGSQMWDSILGLQDHALSQRWLNHWATQASQSWLLNPGLAGSKTPCSFHSFRVFFPYSKLLLDPEFFWVPGGAGTKGMAKRLM